MKRFWLYIFQRVAFASILIVAASCGKEPILSPHGARSRIVPIVKSVATKAEEDSPHGEFVSERIVSSADGFDLIEMVYENDGWISGGDYETKGSVVTTGSLSGFSIDAYAEGEWHDNTIKEGDPGSKDNPNSAGLYFKASSTKSGSSWGLSKTGGPARVGTGDQDGALFWLNNVPMTFWSYNIVEPVRTSTYKASFGYKVNSDVSKQEDPVFAFSKETRKYHDDGDDLGKLESQSSTSGASNENINIWFYHALSAVQFLQSEDLTDYRISNIEIQNVKDSTVCEITATDNVPATGSPNISFTHNLANSSSVNFSQAYAASDPSLVGPSSTADDIFKPTDGKTFIMIPQERTASKVKVTFTYTGTPASTTSPTFDFNGTWVPGKFYVYKIDLTGNVHVKILETCSDSVKSDVKFQNTSNVNEYIRATVIANWYDNNGNIVAAWDKTRDGDITLGSGWTTGSDGFYYYTQPVATQATTANLFDSFTKPTTPPVTGAHFEMTVMTQAVASDGISSYSSAF